MTNNPHQERERENGGLWVGTAFEIFRLPQAVSPGARIPIILGPGRAFGSGEHETTAACLEAMENLTAIKGGKILDLGCGTGILSLAAAHLGARHVTAVDPDPNSIETTLGNVERNGLEKKITALQGELDGVSDRDYDVVLANLYGHILLTLVDGIASRLVPGGKLLLSGMLYEYHYDVRTTFERLDFEVLEERYMEEYTLLVLGKPGRRGPDRTG